MISPFGDIEGSGYSMSKFANVVMTRMFPYFRKVTVILNLQSYMFNLDFS